MLCEILSREQSLYVLNIKSVSIQTLIINRHDYNRSFTQYKCNTAVNARFDLRIFWNIIIFIMSCVLFFYSVLLSKYELIVLGKPDVKCVRPITVCTRLAW